MAASNPVVLGKGLHADWEAAGMEATAFAEKELKSALEVRFGSCF
jgi:hypothetical protein